MTSLATREPELLALLHRAAKRCGRRKQSRRDVLAYRLREGEVLLDLATRISEGRYAPGPGRVFVTERPKFREIHAADYQDRIVHHLLYDLLAPRFVPRFVDATFACLPGRGTHAAARRLQQLLWNATRHGGVRAYALQLDVRSFFPSIHKQTLLALLEPVLRELPRLSRDPRGHRVRDLVHVVVGHDSTRAVRCGPSRAFARVPEHKRLGAFGSGTGLPIGNLTSQFFANIYLDPLDKLVTRGLGCRGYVRYVDDFVLVDRDAARLRAMRDEITSFCEQRLRLSLHPGAEPVPVSQGVDFAGYVIRPRYVLPRRRVVVACRQRVRGLVSALARATLREGERARLAGVGWVTGPLTMTRVDGDLPERLRAAFSSYYGHFAHASAWRLCRRLWHSAPLARRLLRLRGAGAALRLPPARVARNFREQRAQLRRGLQADVLLVRVGRYVVLPAWAGRRLGLRARARYGARFVAPHQRAPGLACQLVQQGLRVALAVERPWPHGPLKRREVRWLLEPAPAGANPGECT